MIKNGTKNIYLSFVAFATLVACSPQTTPTMMSTSPVELSRETVVEQILATQINDVNLLTMAEQYRNNGNGPLDLTMTYNPKSRSFTAMSALHDLKRIKETLRSKGVTNVSTQTLAVPEGKPSLIVSYDVIRAQAPSDCAPMPGLDNNETGRFIGDYKFGCGTESLIAKQIARPSDLEGNSDLASHGAQRGSIILDRYKLATPKESLDGVERGDISND